jgi:peptidoglycan glycosyltransferase
MLDDLVAVWEEGDADSLHELLHPSSPWIAPRLRAMFERNEVLGAIDSIDIGVGATEVHATESRAEAPYSITYRSAAAADPVVLEGTLDLFYSEDAGRWYPAWDQSLPFPGIDNADGFAVTTRYPTRAAILDRTGRRLAVGPAGSRRYPFGSAAGTTIGHLEPLAKKDIEEGNAREPGDLVGGSGLEEAFEKRLSGRPATKLQVVNRRGRVVKTVGRRAARPGHPVRTTLDIRVQQAAAAAYGGTTGGAVVLDPRNGDILAAVASSPFDPGNYVGSAGIEPFNRALSGLYPPGSAMKVMTASAALETGTFKPTTQLTGPAEYKGVRNFESGDFGSLSFASALQNSVNTAFAQIAEKLGPRRLTRFARLFGFNRDPEMPLEAATSSFPFPLDEGDLLWSAIGQAQTLATPLQMASIAATIANDGRRMEPRIALGAKPSGSRVVSAPTAATMTTLMEGVVQGGTGVGAAISGVRVAGKTGTAEVDVGGERRNHAWFIAFAPAGDPRIAVAVVSEYGGIGGRVAAPLARAILTSVLPLVR